MAKGADKERIVKKGTEFDTVEREGSTEVEGSEDKKQFVVTFHRYHKLPDGMPIGISLDAVNHGLYSRAYSAALQAARGTASVNADQMVAKIKGFTKPLAEAVLAVYSVRNKKA